MLSNAVSYPGTMMVELRDANLTSLAMVTTFWLFSNTFKTYFVSIYGMKKLLVGLSLGFTVRD